MARVCGHLVVVVRGFGFTHQLIKEKGEDKAKYKDKDIIKDNENDTDQDITQASCLPRPPPSGRRTAVESGHPPWPPSMRPCTPRGLGRKTDS